MRFLRWVIESAIMTVTIMVTSCSPIQPPASLQVVAERPDSSITVSGADGAAILEIHSPSGIGAATVSMGEGLAPRQIVLRFFLNGLEELRLSYADVELIVSVPSQQTGEVLQLRSVNGQQLTIERTDPAWMEVRTPGKHGYNSATAPNGAPIEVVLPADFQRRNPRQFTMAWIDFFR